MARYLYRKSYPASAIAPYTAAKVNLGLVRKALRVGKNLEHFKAAAIAMQSPLAKVSPPPLRTDLILFLLMVGYVCSFGCVRGCIEVFGCGETIGLCRIPES